MQVTFNPYKYNSYNNYGITTPSFKGVANTMSQNLDILVSETKKLYRQNRFAQIKDFEAIIKKISPETTVKHYSEVPAGSNTSPQACAYFSQKTQINNRTNEMIVDDKIVYLNPDNLGPNPRLKLFSEFVHEGTHIAQEESADRISSLDFSKQVLRSNMSPFAKQETLMGGVRSFTSIEYNILLPLIEAMKKENEMPERVPYANKEFLNMLYKQMTGYSTQDFIKAVAYDIMSQIKKIFPLGDTNYMLKYTHKKAGHEKEAYKVSLDFLKDVLNMYGATDLDFRILLYDDFEQAIKSMIH